MRRLGETAATRLGGRAQLARAAMRRRAENPQDGGLASGGSAADFGGQHSSMQDLVQARQEAAAVSRQAMQGHAPDAGDDHRAKRRPKINPTMAKWTKGVTARVNAARQTPHMRRTAYIGNNWLSSGVFVGNDTFVCGGEDKQVTMFDMASNRQTNVIRRPEGITGIVVSPDQSQLCVADGDGSVHVYRMPMLLARRGKLYNEEAEKEAVLWKEGVASGFDFARGHSKRHHQCSCDACSVLHGKLAAVLPALATAYGLESFVGHNHAKKPYVPKSEHTCGCPCCDLTLHMIEGRLEAIHNIAKWRKEWKWRKETEHYDLAPDATADVAKRKGKHLERDVEQFVNPLARPASPRPAFESEACEVCPEQNGGRSGGGGGWGKVGAAAKKGGPKKADFGTVAAEAMRVPNYAELEGEEDNIAEGLEHTCACAACEETLEVLYRHVLKLKGVFKTIPLVAAVCYMEYSSDSKLLVLANKEKRKIEIRDPTEAGMGRLLTILDFELADIGNGAFISTATRARTRTRTRTARPPVPRVAASCSTLAMAMRTRSRVAAAGWGGARRRKGARSMPPLGRESSPLRCPVRFGRESSP